MVVPVFNFQRNLYTALIVIAPIYIPTNTEQELTLHMLFRAISWVYDDIYELSYEHKDADIHLN